METEGHGRTTRQEGELEKETEEEEKKHTQNCMRWIENKSETFSSWGIMKCDG